MNPRACHCDDFSRSRLLRRAVAEAGRGLPSIEPGMPLPAGTGLSRQSFLLRSAGLALAVYGLDRVRPGLLEDGIAQAATGGGQPILVSVFLEGGADGLSMLYPAGDPLYRKLRPKLSLGAAAGTVFAEDDRLHWHPALAPLAGLHAKGKVSVIPAIGYTNADQSHFTSRHYWEVGATASDLRTGWLGRYLDVVGSPDNPLQGLSLDGQLSPSLASARVPVAAIDAPASYDLGIEHVWGEVETRMHETLRALGAREKSADPARRAVGSVAVQADRLREQLIPFGGDERPQGPVAYPDGGDESFPKQLASLAELIAAGLPLRCVALGAPGEYDTHAAQPDALSKGLTLTAASLEAFQRDLEARGIADRVLVHVWSEFGRRPEENGSAGTDHGAAGVGFVIGTRVRGKMIGEFPGLKDGLDSDGNLKATADFRGLYCALIEQWLGADAGAIVPGASGFQRPALIA
jgi:uncharacterized protein (DUF1501 family)